MRTHGPKTIIRAIDLAHSVEKEFSDNIVWRSFYPAMDSMVERRGNYNTDPNFRAQ